MITMAATEMITTRNGAVFTLCWKERKAMRSVIKSGTHLRIKETWKLTSSRFHIQARTSYQMEELSWVIEMLKS